MFSLKLFKKCLAEALGAFSIVFVGCGMIVSDQLSAGQVSTVAVALCFGFVIATMIYATGHISGAHFNPAVTIAFWAAGYFPKREVLAYILFQCGGAVVASFFHKSFLSFSLSSATQSINLGVTQPFDNVYLTAVIWEFLLTFLLMFVIIAVSTDSRAISSVSGVAIGGVVAFEAMFAGYFSGASMNPARSVGPALVSSNLNHLSAYFVGPILGAICGAYFYKFIKCTPDDKSHVKGCC